MSEFEDRKIPQPIGTERAHKKNPGFSPVPRNNITSALDSNQSMWSQSLNDMMNVESSEWLTQASPQQTQPQSHSSLANDNILPNPLRYMPDETQQFDQPYQVI